MFMAVAAETFKHPSKGKDYRIWYLEIDRHGLVIGVGVKTREELISNLFEHYRKTGISNWRAFKKNADSSTAIEVFDFIAKNIHENTHFGNLPTLSEFQATLNALQLNLELKCSA